MTIINYSCSELCGSSRPIPPCHLNLSLIMQSVMDVVGTCTNINLCSTIVTTTLKMSRVYSFTRFLCPRFTYSHLTVDISLPTSPTGRHSNELLVLINPPWLKTQPTIARNIIHEVYDSKSGTLSKEHGSLFLTVIYRVN